jgi:hypothetical protein
VVGERGFDRVESEKNETAKKRLNLVRKMMEYFFITARSLQNFISI